MWLCKSTKAIRKYLTPTLINEVHFIIAEIEVLNVCLFLFRNCQNHANHINARASTMSTVLLTKGNTERFGNLKDVQVADSR